MNLSLAERAALADCAPTLRRYVRGFRRAPGVSRVTHPFALVRRLVARELLAWGNPARNFALLTSAGKAALQEAA